MLESHLITHLLGVSLGLGDSRGLADIGRSRAPNSFLTGDLWVAPAAVVQAIDETEYRHPGHGQGSKLCGG